MTKKPPPQLYRHNGLNNSSNATIPKDRSIIIVRRYYNPCLIISIMIFYALVRWFDFDSSTPVVRTLDPGTQHPPVSLSDTGILGRLLHDANIPPTALSDEQIAQLETKITHLYGPSPVIVGGDDCDRYRTNVTTSQRQLAVAGMFNTGTNLLDNQLRKNLLGLAQHHLWQVPWGKHRMAGVKDTHTAPQMDRYDKHSVLPIVVIRHPLAWVQSMCDHPYAAVWKHRQDHCPNFVFNNTTDPIAFPNHRQPSFPVTVEFDDHDHKTFDSLIHLWNGWYRQYLSVDYPILVVRYEDLVFQPHLVLNEIATCVGGGATIKSPFEYQTKTSKSHGSGTDLIRGIIKTANLDRPRDILPDPNDYEYYRHHVDTDLIRLFHYYQ